MGMNKEEFEQKLKPLLLYMGTIVASVMAIAYIFVVFVLIEGFKAEALLNTTLFSIITAAIGFCIMQMLKIQGQSFAKNLEKNKELIKEYSLRKSAGKKRKYRSMKYFWFTSATSDVLIKCLTLAATSIGMIYIMIEGSGDYSLLILAAVNLLMFAGFGLISLVKAYDFFNEEYVPYMLNEIEETNRSESERKGKEALEMAQKRDSKQTDDLVRADNICNILDTGVGACDTGNSDEPVVLDSGDKCDFVLGGTIYTSLDNPDSNDDRLEEISSEN